MKTSIGTLLVLLVGGLLLSSCSDRPKVPYPTDAELIARYQNNREAFQMLAENPFDEALQDRLGVITVRVEPGLKSDTYFQVWIRDLIGTGASVKGLAYLENEPAENRLVSSIDNTVKPGGPGDFDLLIRIENGWYVFYQSSD